MKVKTRTTTRKVIKKRSAHALMRKRICRFCADKIKTVDYKDVKKLEYFVNDRGKIVSSRLSGNCAKHQRRVADAIGKARFISLIPYVK